MDISTQDLKYVCALARHLHFGKAATDSNTSQPNLSIQIKKVEGELGVSLFERSNKRVLLTSKGAEVVAHFKSILARLDEVKAQCDAGSHVQIKIGIFPTLAPYLLSRVLPNLKKDAPNIELYIVEDKTDIIVEKLQDGDLDCILAAHPITAYEFDYDIIFDEPFYLAVSIGNPLSKRDLISVSELNNETVLLLKEGHCLRDQALEVCYAESLSIDPNVESSSLETLIAMVAGNMGVTFVPQLSIRETPGVKHIRVKEPLSRSIALYWRTSSANTVPYEHLSKIVRKRVGIS